MGIDVKNPKSRFVKKFFEKKDRNILNFQLMNRRTECELDNHFVAEIDR